MQIIIIIIIIVVIIIIKNLFFSRACGILFYKFEPIVKDLGFLLQHA
jgi:hypothetical protein